jgi:hypothetical protein
MNTAAFVLILFAHVGPMGEGNSNALTVSEFTSQARCEAAGKAARKLASNSVKSIEWVCVAK